MKMIIRFIFILVIARAGLVACVSAEEPLTQVKLIRSLSNEEAALALPVKLTGVVIYNGWYSLVLHDGTSSIYLDFEHSQKQGIWKGPLPNLTSFMPGAGLEVDGFTDPGGFSPMVLVANFRGTGPQSIPPPLRPTAEQLLSSSHDTHWVEVEGVVRKVEDPTNGPRYISLLVGGHPCPVLVTNRSGLSCEQLVDAKVRVRGVLLNIANLRSQTAGMKIHSSWSKDIEILIPPPSDPFKAPRVELNRLISFRPDANLGHRRVSSGVVTFTVPGQFFYLLDQDACVRVNSSQAQVTPGDLVEISGFIDNERLLASFSETLVRKIGTGTVPRPEKPLISEILNPKTRSSYEMVSELGHPDYDGRLIRLSGILRRVIPPNKDGNTTVVVESGEHLIYAFLPGMSPAWLEGSVVEFTGVCELEMERLDKLPWLSITGFHIWLSSPADLRVISEPSWWTPQRLAILLAALLFLLGVTLVWGYAMRRQVAVRGGQLAVEIAARESAKLEFDAILRERQRFANDLHDTLEQALTGLALQLEIVSRNRTSNSTLSGHHLNLAQQFLERSREEVHRTVWDLRYHGQDGQDFFDILKVRALSMVEGSSTNITLKREGGEITLSDLIAGNLLLLAQEAVTNALKHSGASKIYILLKLSPEYIELVIEDSGCGFDISEAPGSHEGHFGLQGMRERSKRIGGQIELKTATGQGTIIVVKVPFAAGESHKSI